MSKGFTNMKELEKALLQHAKNYVEQATKEIEQIVVDYISDWEMSNQNIVQEFSSFRLGNLLNNSINIEMKQTKNGYQAEISLQSNDELNHYLETSNIAGEIQTSFIDGFVLYMKKKGIELKRN